MIKEAPQLPEYDDPPVTEVVCGIQFEPLGQFLSPHLGLLWQRFREDYPECQEAPPLVPIIEDVDRMPISEAQVGEVPWFPRVWFIHKHQSGLIQVQRDRFLYNWRKVSDRDAYPRYHKVIELFRRYLGHFTSFLEEHRIGSLTPRQYELTYVNHVVQGSGWDTLADVGRVFPDLSLRSDPSRFIPSFEGFSWRASVLLPDRKGRLHIHISSGRRHSDGRDVLVLELTARGMPSIPTADEMYIWFDMAREYIVRGFSDLTSEEIQRNIWHKR